MDRRASRHAHPADVDRWLIARGQGHALARAAHGGDAHDRGAPDDRGPPGPHDHGPHPAH